jgi:hypothetical protein
MLSDVSEPGPMDGIVMPVPQVETEERCDIRCQPVDESDDLLDLGILQRVEREVKEL